VPTNIEETDDAFVLSLHAAGLDKSDFQVKVRDDLLTIACQAQEAMPTSRKYTRRETQGQGFEREFALNGKVVIEDIEAHYDNGVLTVRLPKNADAMRPAQDITVQ
jgi:HSP20 family protein